MGNLCSRHKKNKKNDTHTQLMHHNPKKCPYCNFEFETEKMCIKHSKNCIYNRKENHGALIHTDNITGTIYDIYKDPSSS